MPRGLKGYSRPQVLSIPERLDAHPTLTGKGVVMAFVDVGFYPHPDLMRPEKRILAYADATRDVPVPNDFFAPHIFSWHGTMTACCAAGNGYMSGGRYRGLASDAEVVLIKALGAESGIAARHIAHALRFPLRHPQLGIQVLNCSLGCSPYDPDAADVEDAAAEVVEAGITLFAAAGNQPGQTPHPPASAAAAIAVGGGNDRNTREPDDDVPWPSSYGGGKPDFLAPAIWLPAPMLPGTLVEREAGPLFRLLSVLEEASAEHHFSKTRTTATPEETASVEELMERIAVRIARKKYISPDYQHVEGTSFASPIAASVAAQMLEADPTLTPTLIREGLTLTAEPIRDVPREVQGAGVLRPRLAVRWALERVRERDGEASVRG